MGPLASQLQMERVLEYIEVGRRERRQGEPGREPEADQRDDCIIELLPQVEEKVGEQDAASKHTEQDGRLQGEKIERIERKVHGVGSCAT